MKILIVEDDENSRILLETALCSSGYDVICAENGKVALESALKNPPDIIVSDILMPEMDGYELCKEIKSDKNLRKIPFVFYSATYTDPKDERLAMDLGAAKFIVKPMEIDLLLIEIVNILQRVEKSKETYPEKSLKNAEELHRDYSKVITKKLDDKVRQLEMERNKLRKSEGIIKQNLQKLHGIIENISMGVVMIDSDMRVMEINRRMRQWFPDVDSSCNPLCYKSFNDPPSEDACIFCPVKRTFEDGQVHEEILKKTRDGNVRIYRLVSSPICDEKGVVTAAIEIVEDITEKIEIEIKMDQAQKLEAIGTLAGGIAHDFNNILTSILGYTELALDDVEKGTVIENDLLEIYSAGKRAKDLVHQILLFARKSSHERKPIIISKVISEVMRFIRSAIPTTIEIKQDINSSSLVLGDSTQIHQIMMNLCTNAAQSMEDEGTLTVTLNDAIFDEASSVISGVKEAGEYLVLKVSDTGKGIDKDIVGKIFNPYFTTKEPGEGTGLGLALVHGIIESYGGSISVSSEKGEGTTFTIYLPILKTGSEHFLPQEEVLPTGDERILYVDDEISIGEISEEILSRLGYSVSVCTDSIKALELFRENPHGYDLVITDMTMPNMTGDRLAKEILKIKKDAAVILFTGYNKKITPDIASKIGIKELAYKPIIKADLAKMIRKVLDGL